MEIGKVCIASWGSYNSCNETEATLGVWVDFNDFEELSEIEEHLKNRHGFDIDGIDEELFIIDDDNGLYPYDANLASAWERYEILKNIDINILKILSDSENIRSMDLDELEKIGEMLS